MRLGGNGDETMAKSKITKIETKPAPVAKPTPVANPTATLTLIRVKPNGSATYGIPSLSMANC
jgi:hypothetical protein